MRPVALVRDLNDRAVQAYASGLIRPVERRVIHVRGAAAGDGSIHSGVTVVRIHVGLNRCADGSTLSSFDRKYVGRMMRSDWMFSSHSVALRT
jgi:hypothetical protein